MALRPSMLGHICIIFRYRQHYILSYVSYFNICDEHSVRNVLLTGTFMALQEIC